MDDGGGLAERGASLHDTDRGVFQEHTRTVALQSSAIDFPEGWEFSKFSMRRPTCDIVNGFSPGFHQNLPKSPDSREPGKA